MSEVKGQRREQVKESHKSAFTIYRTGRDGDGLFIDLSQFLIPDTKANMTLEDCESRWEVSSLYFH